MTINQIKSLQNAYLNRRSDVARWLATVTGQFPQIINTAAKAHNFNEQNKRLKFICAKIVQTLPDHPEECDCERCKAVRGLVEELKENV